MEEIRISRSDARLLVASVAFLALCVATSFAIRAARPATAQDWGSVATGGTNPLITLAGTTTAGQVTTVYTVPNDRDFVLTAGVWYSSLTPLRDSVGPRLDPYASADNVFNAGTGHMTFGPGEPVQLDGTTTSQGYAYYLQGYLAQP